MKAYLAIDTSTPLGSVALGRGDRLLAELVVGVQARHSESLLPAVDYALRSAGVEVAELGAVVVAGGPGSFTGVRVAGATAKGLVRSLGVPLYAYSGLMALAASAADQAPVCALYDARRGEVYAACYRFPSIAVSNEEGGTAETAGVGLGAGVVERGTAQSAVVDVVLEPRAAPLEEVLDALEGASPLYVGEGALRYREAIEAAGGRVAPAHRSASRASALLWLADRVPDLGLVEDPPAWEPEYLRGAGVDRGVLG